MRAGPGRGALVGAAAGVLLAVALFLLPAVLRGDTYEITDPLVFAGVPLAVFGAGLGALVGLRPGRPGREAAAAPDAPDARRRTAVVAGVAVVAMALAVWTVLWATGVVPVSPFGLG